MPSPIDPVLAALNTWGPVWLPPVAGVLLVVGGAVLGRIFRLPVPEGTVPSWPARGRRALGGLAAAFGLFLVATAGGAHDAADWETDLERGLRQAEESGQPVVVDCWDRYCAACETIWNQTLRHPDVDEALAGHVRIKLDMERPENAVLYERWGFRDLPFVIAFDGAAAAREGRFRNLTAAAQAPDRFLAALSGEDTPEESLADSFSRRGLLATLLVVFLAGLAVSFTPCVLPVYILTVNVIGARRASSVWGRLGLSAVYVLGLALTYSVLGVLAGLGSVSMGLAFQNPVVLGALAGLFALLALFYLEILHLPQAGGLAAKITAGSRSNVLTAFGLGAAAGLIAAPCVGPMLVGILSWIGARGDALSGFGVMFTFALGMGALFLALGTSTAVLDRVRKTGAWGYRLEIVFGVVFLALGFYYVNQI